MQLPEYTQHKDTDKRIKSAIMALKALTVLDLYPEHREELLTVCLWKITTADGNANGKSKKFKIKFRSEKVIKSLSTPKEKNLRHDHVYTRKLLIDRIINNPDKIDDIVKDAIGCVVTKDEHDKLHSVDEKLQGWERYKAAGIKVWDLKEGKKHKIK